MDRLWQLVISGLSILFLTSAKPAVRLLATTKLTTSYTATSTPITAHYEVDLWEHVNKTCLTNGSICDEAVNLHHLQQLERYMNKAMDPCENFHEYACGNWHRYHEQDTTTMMKFVSGKVTQKLVKLFEYWHKMTSSAITESSRRSNLVQDMDGDIEFQLEFEFLHAHDHDSDKLHEDQQVGSSVVAEKMLHYYRVCKRSESHGKLKLRGYFDQMREQGLWKLNNYSWLESLAQLTRFGYSEHFLQMHVKQRNASYYSITVMPHDDRKPVKLTTEIYNVLRDYTEKDYKMLVHAFGKIERDISQIHSIDSACIDSSEDSDCDTMETFTLHQLQTKCSIIDWQLFLGIPMGRRMRPMDLISVEDLSKIKEIALYLQSVEPDLLYLYTMAKFANYLQDQPHNPLLTGASSANCIRHMRKVFYIPMTYIFERIFYSQVRPENDRIIRYVFEQIKNEFAQTLQRNRMQFSSTALQYLQDKLDSLRLNLGNLPVNVSKDFYVEYVRDIQLNDNFYFNNLQALTHFYTQQHHLAELPASQNTNNAWHSFSLHPPDFPDNIDASPYYFCLSNMIMIPHAYLQPPFYERNFWPTLLYGDLATTLGHELIHAFDNNFIQYDQYGNLNDSYKEIEENPFISQSLKCLQPGTKFVSERIADISGTRLALHAFTNETDFMRYNGKLFFLQFAQFFCGAANLSTFQAEDPYHDLDSLRLNYTLAHTPVFAEVFNCPLGSPMNPVHKCEMW